MTHTPGPWRVCDEQEQILGPEGEIIVWETGTNEANNRLIAAAPELLEALEAIATGAYDTEGDWRSWVIERARAAIAKARGV
jgi:hypothetical protein